MGFIISVILVVYTLFILLLLLGYNRLDSLKEAPVNAKASVIVAFRNEQKNLPTLLNSIIKQTYSKNKFEVIFVNDHSEDDGVQLIDQYLEGSGVTYKIIHLESSHGKKKAIEYGVNSSQNETIVITDADCEMKSDWLRNMIGFFVQKNAVLLSGPVVLKSTPSIFSRIQATEFATLITSSAALIGLKLPMMVNAANLVFSKEAFQEVKPYSSNEKVSSGDDIFLLHELKKHTKYRNRIFFANASKVAVYTDGKNTIKTFLDQRIRWASKSKYYRDKQTLLIGFLIFLVNVLILIVFFQALWGVFSWNLLLFVVIYKWMLDTLLLILAPSWVDKKNLLIRTFLLSILYPIYSIGIALLSLLYRPQWKGRKI